MAGWSLLNARNLVAAGLVVVIIAALLAFAVTLGGSWNEPAHAGRYALSKAVIGLAVLYLIVVLVAICARVLLKLFASTSDGQGSSNNDSSRLG